MHRNTTVRATDGTMMMRLLFLLFVGLHIAESWVGRFPLSQQQKQRIFLEPLPPFTDAVYNKRQYCCPSRRQERRNVPRLHAVPPSVWWIVGHELLGAAPVPFIASATKRGGWLTNIDRPPWNPPDWLFAPMWTFLYATMGLAVSKIYHSSSGKASVLKTPWLMALWAVHFALNVSWAPVFFSLQRFRSALIISCLMVATLAVIIPLFYAVDPTAGLILLPYLVWITFATVLNGELCRRNPTVHGYNNGMLQAQIQRLQADAAKYADSLMNDSGSVSE